MPTDSLTVGDLRALIHYDGPETDTLGDALAQINAATAASRENETAWAEHLARCEVWIAGRDEAARDAHAQAVAASTRGGRGAVNAAGQDAGRAAAKDYEERVPRPLFNGKPTIPLHYSDEKPRPLAAAVARVKELVS